MPLLGSGQTWGSHSHSGTFQPVGEPAADGLSAWPVVTPLVRVHQPPAPSPQADHLVQPQGRDVPGPPSAVASRFPVCCLHRARRKLQRWLPAAHELLSICAAGNGLTSSSLGSGASDLCFLERRLQGHGAEGPTAGCGVRGAGDGGGDSSTPRRDGGRDPLSL